MSATTEIANRIELLKQNIEALEADGYFKSASIQQAVLARYEAELAGNDDLTEVEVPSSAATSSNPRSLTSRPKAGGKAGNQYGTFEVRYATQKQTDYISSLMGRKDLSKADGSKINITQLQEQVAATQVNKKAASAIIDFLLDLPDKPTTTQTAPRTLGAPATEKQKNFIRVLLSERAGVEAAEAVRSSLNSARQEFRLNASFASATIEELLNITPAEAATIPDGRYALPAEDGHYVFYKVEAGEGTWAGRTFVVQLLGSVGDWSERRLPRGVANSVKERIAEDTEEAARMFGIKARACSYCHSPLSNIQSRAAGYGETCADNHGFSYPTLEEARGILAERGEDVD